MSVPDVVAVLGEVIRQQYIVLQYRINESTSSISLDCSEIHEMFVRIGGSSSTETFSSVLLLLPGKLSKHQLNIVKYPYTLPSAFLPGRQILQLHHLIDKLYHHVATI